MRKCKKCGAELKDDAIFCTECGEKLEETLTNIPVEENRDKNLQNIKAMIKSKKMIALIIAIAVIAVIAIVYMVNIKNAIKITDYCEVSYSGGEGFGTANIKLNYEALEAAICEMEGYSLDSAGYWTIVDAVEGNNIEVSVSPNENLSNGDKIEVKVNVLNEKAIKGVKLVEGSESVKVEGLVKYREITDEELFKDIEVVYTDCSPFLEVEVENISKDPFLESVDYKIQNSGEIANGDTITIEASWSEDFANENQCVVTGSGKKKITVKGQAEYLLNKEAVTDEILQQIKAEVEKDYKDAVSNAFINVKELWLIDNTNYKGHTNKLFVLIEIEPGESGKRNGDEVWYFDGYYWDISIRDGNIELGELSGNFLFNVHDNTNDFENDVKSAKEGAKAYYNLLDQ